MIRLRQNDGAGFVFFLFFSVGPVRRCLENVVFMRVLVKSVIDFATK